MSDKTSLGDRMKRYEAVSQGSLMRRTPVIIRLDGKAFHTFTKKISQHNDSSLKTGPFSEKLHQIMEYTSFQLTKQIQNAKLAYFQSDEISILLTDWSTLTTDQWFGGNIQKIVSVSASIATAQFNKRFQEIFGVEDGIDATDIAYFDSRVFNLPKEEVTNYFIWRQQDATRNSINMLAQFYFSHNELHEKSTSQVQDMLMLEKGVNWNNLEVWKKRGTCVHIDPWDNVLRADSEIPIFTQSRAYIEYHLQSGTHNVKEFYNDGD